MITESQKWHLDFEYLYLTMKIDMSILNFLINFKEIICFESWNLNSNLLFWILEINISIRKIITWL